MKILVTGSAGHLGEALVRSLRSEQVSVCGVDIKDSEFTNHVGTITDRKFVAHAARGCDAIIHTATLHKPHVGTHTRQQFIDTNITGTLNLLEEATANDSRSFIYTSTTSTFGDAMKPAPGDPAVWVTESLSPKPKNIYGVTKTSAEDLCALFSRNTDLSCIVLKTSRFFPEEDDAKKQRETFTDDNLKVNELLFRRVDIADIVNAHWLAIEKADEIKFDTFIISATTPFSTSDAAALGINAPAVLQKYVPEFVNEYERRNWTMFKTLDRVYDNSKARKILGWEPEYTFKRAINRLRQNADYRSEISRLVGSKGYHNDNFEEGPYPVTGF